MSVWDTIKNDWLIIKKELIALGIDPDKDWGSITLDELSALADFLDVCVEDII